MSLSFTGVGHENPKWILYIANRPELEHFQTLDFRQLESGEAAEIIKLTSNHWRKVFSIMAKISFALFDTDCETWQQYRDTKLLTKEGFEAISFSPYKTNDCLPFSIICGFNYADKQVELESLLSHERQNKILFSQSERLCVTPYFDWRQLNNEMLSVLTQALKHRMTRIDD